MIRDFIGDQVQSGCLFDGTYGIEIETESKQLYDPPQMKFWSAKRDGSLRDVGYEYILKVPLRYGKELDDGLQEFKDKTKNIKFIEDSNSTSVHVHVNMLPESWKTMANFLTLYTLVENILIEVSGEFRRNNLFCLPIRSVPYIITIMKEIYSNVNRKNYKFGRQIGSEREQNAIKYAALNIGCLQRFGSVEIRSFRGVSDTDVIHSWVSIINAMLEHSRMDTNPVDMLESYHKKDLRFLKDVFKDYWDLIKYDNMKELIEPNLWYAGDFGYSFTVDQWNKMDIKPEKRVANKAVRNPKILDRYAMNMFGFMFAALGRFDRDVVYQMYDNDERDGILAPEWNDPLAGGVVQFDNNQEQPPVLPHDWLERIDEENKVVLQELARPRKRKRAAEPRVEE